MYGVRGVKVLLALLVGLALTVPASASRPITLVFDRSQASPHTLVLVKTAPNGTLRRFRKRSLPVYLRTDPLVRLGRLTVSRHGNGTMRFIVPNVPPGRYDALLRGLPGQPALRVVGSFGVVDGAVRRTCEQSVYGKLGDDWFSRARTVGPVHMVGFGSDPPDRDRSTGEYAMKVLLVIDEGPPITLAVAPEDRAVVALSYIFTRFNVNRVTDQDAAVTFEPCAGDATTQFNGSFVFRRPLCAHLTVTVEGREPIPFALQLGRAC